MKDPLQIATFRPVVPDHVVSSKEGTLGDKLSSLLRAEANGSSWLELTREGHQQWLRGLMDGGVPHARRIYDMLSVHQKAIVSFQVEEGKP